MRIESTTCRVLKSHASASARQLASFYINTPLFINFRHKSLINNLYLIVILRILNTNRMKCISYCIIQVSCILLLRKIESTTFEIEYKVVETFKYCREVIVGHGTGIFVFFFRIFDSIACT